MLLCSAPRGPQWKETEEDGKKKTNSEVTLVFTLKTCAAGVDCVLEKQIKR